MFELVEALFLAPEAAPVEPIAFTLRPDPVAINHALEKRRVPALAYASMRDCRLETVGYFGIVDKAAQRPAGPDTLWEAASLTKSVFGYLVMRLVEDGKIELDAPLADDMDAPRIADKARYARLTPRLILQHQSGLPNWADDVDNKIQLTEPLDFIAEPGEGFHYSGEAYQLLAIHVQNRTNMTLHEIFRHYLGEVMPRSSFERTPDGMVPAIGYFPIGEREFAIPAFPSRPAAAPGGLVTTPTDFAAFMGHLCREEGLSPAGYEEMLGVRNSIEPTPQDRRRRIHTSGYGFGFAVERYGDRETIYHYGHNGNFEALYLYDRMARDGIVYFTNAKGGDAVIHDVAGLYPWEEAEE
ncbi:serine hydrolase domain-containing protein [Sphingomicrobium arenosum]|uniref:serine hydrolase domain-containing protein n=1 Tax=Sphingomicrobium arenosum TaxID=2233861 RepID=UPI002241013F|nr:serine hydrolase domain-containing protein [Sphingomicrobium arenosum]